MEHVGDGVVVRFGAYVVVKIERGAGLALCANGGGHEIVIEFAATLAAVKCSWHVVTLVALRFE